MNYGRYRIVKELGGGSMGVVYQAHDPQIDRLIALKVLRQDRVVSQAFVQRFSSEAKAVGRLSHPNIVMVYDVGQDHGTIYIAMEFLEGKPLNEIIQEKKLSLKELVDIGVQTAGALDYAHQKGIVHRDIKPSNIILTSQGQVKVTDFGIARIEDPSGYQQTQAGEVLGTPLYMSPEQVIGHPVDGRSDIHSLGVILYELATGKRPFSGENLVAIFKSITEDVPDEPLKIDPSIPAEISQLIIRSLEKKPGDRFQRGNAMAEALRACLRKEKPPPPPKKGQHVGIFVIVAFFCLIVTGGLLYYFLTIRKPTSTLTDKQAPIQRSVLIPTPKPIALIKPSPASKPKPVISLKSNAPVKTPIALKPKPAIIPTPKAVARAKPDSDSKPKSAASSTLASPPPPKIQSYSEKKLRTILRVDSEPTGAEFFVNGKYEGKTPYQIALPLGKYEVRLSLKDHYGWEAQLKLNKEGEMPLRIRLSPVN